LAELTDESNGASAFAILIVASSSVLAINIEAKISFLAADSLPATSALAFSAGAFGTVVALNSEADVSGLTGTESVLTFSLAVALAIIVALVVSENVLGLVSEVIFLTAVSGVSLAELEEVAGSLTITVAVVIASGQARLLYEVERAFAAGESLAIGAVVTLSAGTNTFLAASTVAWDTVA
jgi:hypothetical protein